MKISPNDFDISGDFFSTEFQNCERETIARNIVFISRPFDKFTPFTWEEYKERCEHKVTDAEKSFLNKLVREKYLDFNDNKYYVKPAFVRAISKYIKVEVKDIFKNIEMVIEVEN